ncbi:hypothetical protein [Vibrio scophthalmi]|uniref:Uncharacterized protein n=1 Tax=Vibrio scophthalmi TaxID=45658 RepID=A0A1C7FEX7_9VIBR|nr:hypothetical protein [Vibrio scophthalmi]ANU38257.1 hypothetical protein VSVS05_03219 [Vibrio scophthalmi]
MHTQYSILNLKNIKQALFVLLSCFMLTGCPLEGDDGKFGVAGVDGVDGVNCWDANSNGINDPEEDINGDNVWDAKDCSSGIQVTQNPDVELNHQHFCEAFAALGQYPDGCPSNTHTPPTGMLTNMTTGQFDGTYNTCSDLSVVTKTNVTPQQAYWTLQGGYVAKKFITARVDRDQCSSSCEGDTQCVASWWLAGANGSLDSGQCHIFYHSDTISAYETLCAVDIPNVMTAADICVDTIGATSDWHAICP